MLRSFMKDISEAEWKICYGMDSARTARLIKNGNAPTYCQQGFAMFKHAMYYITNVLLHISCSYENEKCYIYYIFRRMMDSKVMCWAI